MLHMLTYCQFYTKPVIDKVRLVSINLPWCQTASYIAIKVVMNVRHLRMYMHMYMYMYVSYTFYHAPQYSHRIWFRVCLDIIFFLQQYSNSPWLPGKYGKVYYIRSCCQYLKEKKSCLANKRHDMQWRSTERISCLHVNILILRLQGTLTSFYTMVVTIYSLLTCCLATQLYTLDTRESIHFGPVVLHT